MSHELGSPSSVAIAPAQHPPDAETGQEGPRPTVYCNLTDDHTFSPYLVTRAHVPVLANFGADRLHMCTLHGSWDLKRAVSEQAAALFRSVHWCSNDGKPSWWDDLTFRFGPRAFVYADDTRVIGYATTPREAEDLVKRFSAVYQRPPEPTGGMFHLIKSGREISSEIVPLEAETVLAEETFRLHYGAEGWSWHKDYTAKLNSIPHGLTILEGPPGTGKTSYLRHLMGALRETHRFYFVVLEDSDGALMTRDSDNRAHVSAILNLSDGMLADFLRLQIICTINGRAADIDPALLRPGRLLCHQVFRLLGYAQASRLADRLGRQLAAVRDYSLAEVFAGNAQTESGRTRIGFAA
jgi:hypothetical protein